MMVPNGMSLDAQSMQQGMGYNPYNASNYTSGLYGGSTPGNFGAGSPSGASSPFGNWMNQNSGDVGNALGSSLGALFSQNPFNAGNQYFNQISGQLQNALGPYMQTGQQLNGQLTGQYNQLASNPGQDLAQLGAGYQQSPGYQFQVNQALDGSNRAAAAGGMVGSQANQVQNAGIANQLANQNYNQYLNNALGVQSQGLSGLQGLESQGYNAANTYGTDMSQYYAMLGNNTMNAQQYKNQGVGGLFGSLGHLFSDIDF